MASVSSPEYKVPDKIGSEMPALRKKTNSIRGTAGLKRKLLIKEFARQKTKSTNMLSYMDPPVSPRQASPPAPSPPAPDASTEPAASFVIPSPTLPLVDEVLIVINSP